MEMVFLEVGWLKKRHHALLRRNGEGVGEEQAKPKRNTQDSSSAPNPLTPSTRNPICRVRALYDFPGLEEGELRLTVNDIINVHDDTTFKEWWKGECNGRVGIFPSNYVEKLEASGGSVVSVGGSAGSGTGDTDEQKVERFVGLLANANPRESLSENARIQESYHSVLMLRPKLLSELETSRAKQDELVQLNERFTAACVTYQKLMDASLAAQRAAYQQQPQFAYGGAGGGYPAPYRQQGPPPPQQFQQPYPPQQYQQPPPNQYAPPPAQGGPYYQ
ncbi:UNVERIFIED_CONTAM: ESCRT-0 subunit protein hse1 [Siphonaria sp. JEL0065]|nr:ESCRT-0 subunit protein hse1 [Siphonaria sp. JEL0065]